MATAASPHELSQALIPLPGHERVVRRGFWAKVRGTLGRVPFIDQAIAAFYAANDPGTPARVKGIILAALAYFILPIDVLPDLLAGIGFTDDATVLFLALNAIAPYIRAEHRERARTYLAEQTAT
jgi:uncharacterized membrane protein YkvA (DUF1232 family)